MLSVIVCTRNRVGQLRQCLSFLGECARDFSGGWELIIVDNGSTTENAHELAGILENSEFPVVLVEQPVPGLSNARNKGLQHARGDIIAFTDDDCWVARDWVANIHRAFEQDRNLILLGGRVDFADPSSARLAIRPFDQDYPVTSLSDIQHYLIGCNFAFRKSILEKIGDFDPYLGAGGMARSAEDLDFFYRILCNESVIQYSAGCRIAHAHGRSSPKEIHSMNANYTFGRGFWYAKRIRMGDSQFWRYLYWELMNRAGRFYRADNLNFVRHLLTGLIAGFFVYTFRCRSN